MSEERMLEEAVLTSGWSLDVQLLEYETLILGISGPLGLARSNRRLTYSHYKQLLDNPYSCSDTYDNPTTLG